MIGLSVAMLGSAPGTDRLNMWVEALDDGYTLADIAEHIAASDDFQAAYPSFLTNEEFADAFLTNALGDSVSEAIHAAAVGIVVGLLNDGMTRGELALAAVTAISDVAAAGEDHPAYADLGMAAMAFANQVAVAEHYTLNARMADPSSSVLDGVTSDADTVAAAITAINDDATARPGGEIYNLTALRDNIVGTSGDDAIYAEPVLLGSGATSQSLQPYDAIDGGGGVDTLTVYDITPSLLGSGGLSITTDQVSNVENLVINAQGNVDADVSDWEGLESISLDRFGGSIDITTDGASLTLEQGVGSGANADIDGAGGELALSAHRTSNVDIVTSGHTTSVDVSGGNGVEIDGNGRGGLSNSLTSVSASGFAGNGWGDGELEVSSDALESLSLSSSFGSATVNYETLTELTVNVGGFGGRYRWDGENLSTREGSLILSADDADENVIGDLSVNVLASSKFALDSNITSLTVSGDAALNLQLDGNVDEAGKWVVVTGEGDDATETVVGAQYVIVDPNDATMYSITTDGSDLADDGSNAVLATTTDAITAEARSDGSEDSQHNWETDSIESITVTGSGGLTVNASGQGDLATVDLSGSSGKNSITLNANNDLTSVMGGSGNDTVNISSGTLAAAGLEVDLGAGDDRYIVGAGKSSSSVAVDSSIDGGEGTDTLAMADGSHSTDHTYREGGRDFSIYTGFETLDVGGGSGNYDFALLGVENIQATKGTDGLVTLEKVASGTAINVTGNSSSGMGHTMAEINYQLAERAGGSFDFGSNGVLDVNLVAVGNSGDRAAVPGVAAKVINGVSQVALVLTADAQIQGMRVDSTASLSSSSAATARTSDYENVLCVDATNLVNVMITGDSQVTFKSVATDPMDLDTRTTTALDSVEYLDARSNTAGVKAYLLDAAGRSTNLGPQLTMLGSEAGDEFIGSLVTGVTNILSGGGGGDKLYGGGGVDIYVGGAGADTMGGFDNDGTVASGGADQFRYYAASESQLSFRNGSPRGVDIITDFNGGADTDVINLSRALTENANNRIKTVAADSGGEEFVISDIDDDTNGTSTADTLQEFVGGDNANGLFETSDGFSTTKHFVAVVEQTKDLGEDDQGTDLGEMEVTWVFIDLDGSGDFEAENDMVIQLMGHDIGLTAANFDSFAP